MAKKIGKGLSALLANIEDARVTSAPSEVVEGEKIYNIDINKVFPNPDQPRKYFGDDELEELQNSIREHGILQPLILVKNDEDYMIVAGERRYRAAVAVGLETVPAIVKNLTDRNIREISLVENLQREDLNPIEEAEAMKELGNMYGLTQEELAARLGKARPSVTNAMRLLSLTDEVKDMVRRNRLSAGHARALVPVTDPEVQIDFAYKACDGQMAVRDLETKVRYYLHPELAPKKMDSGVKNRLSLEMRGFVDDMKRIFSTKVKVVGNENKGRIYIDYYTGDDLQRIYELIAKLKNND